MLPLWLCSVTSWSMPLLLIVRSQKYYEMGLSDWESIGAANGTADPRSDAVMAFRIFVSLNFFTLHGSLIIRHCIHDICRRFPPILEITPPRAIIITNIYWLFCAWVNSQIGSNYLYTHGKLPTASLLDLLGPHPWYLLSMEALGIMMCVLLYLPFAIKDKGLNDKH